MSVLDQPDVGHRTELDELRDWLSDQWDPNLTVAEWWDRLGMAGGPSRSSRESRTGAA